MLIQFTGYVRRTGAYDTASMDIHEPSGWLIEIRNGVVIPPPEANTGCKFTEYTPVRWMSGYPEAGTWSEYVNRPNDYVRDRSIFGSAAV